MSGEKKREFSGCAVSLRKCRERKILSTGNMAPLGWAGARYKKGMKGSSLKVRGGSTPLCGEALRSAALQPGCVDKRTWALVGQARERESGAARHVFESSKSTGWLIQRFSSRTSSRYIRPLSRANVIRVLGVLVADVRIQRRLTRPIYYSTSSCCGARRWQ